ncbi:restriction endonuclease subunit S [Pseudomonas sp. CGJS7]|uniref:restriction endonuclease subunit S n=1 Tax=Pseudomonas sp. CGJS7 TaxID=3109348 RepID=UPI00300A5A4C
MPHEFVAAEEWSDKHVLRAGDLLFARSGATVGKTYLHSAALSPAVFAGYCIRFRMGATVLPEFLYGFTKTDAYASWVAATQRPTGQPNINKEEFKTLELPVPPLDIQRRLVAELDAARAERDTALAEADRLPSRLDEEISALLGVVLTPPDERKFYGARLTSVRGSRFDVTYHHPRYIEALRALQAGKGEHLVLQDILLDIAGGATPKAKDESLYAASGIKFLRILNVRPNRLEFSDLNFIQEEVHEGALKRSQLASDDVLMTITGRVGTTAVVSEADLPANINQHIVRLRIDTKRCLPRYLSAFLNTGLGTLLSNRPVSGGTRVALDYGAIRQMPLLLPPVEVQREVVELVREFSASEERLRAHAQAVWQQARERFEQQLLKSDDT